MAEDGSVLEIEIGEIAEYEYVSNLEPGFVCTDCNLEFDAPEDFADHLEKNHETEPLEKEIKLEDLVCPECKFMFTRKNNLWRHVRKFHKHLTPPLKQISYENCHSCPACDRKFTRKSNLLRHIRRFHDFLISTMLHQSPKLYTCPQCDTGFTKWNNCKRHVRHFHRTLDIDQLQKPNIKKLESEFAESTFHIDDDGSIMIDPSAIIVETDDLTLLPCANCDLVFTSETELKEHFKFCLQLNDELKTFEKKTCPLCSFYDSKLNMYLHFTNTHDSPMMIECIDFDSIDDFARWREQVEDESRTPFVELVRKPQSDGTCQTVFVCSLSKESANVCTEGGFCPAEVTLCTTPEKCSILFVKTHIGHDVATTVDGGPLLVKKKMDDDCIKS